MAMADTSGQCLRIEGPSSITSLKSPLQETKIPDKLKSIDGDATLMKETSARRNKGHELGNANIYERSPNNILYKAEGKLIGVDEEQSTKQDAHLSAILES